MIRVNWSEFKSFIDAKGLSIQWLELADKYALKAIEGPLIVSCEIDLIGADATRL